MTYLWLFEDISGNGVEVSQVFDGGDVLRDGLDHHLTGRQHQLMGSHLRQQQYKGFNPHAPGCVGSYTMKEAHENIYLHYLAFCLMEANKNTLCSYVTRWWSIDWFNSLIYGSPDTEQIKTKPKDNMFKWKHFFPTWPRDVKRSRKATQITRQWSFGFVPFTKMITLQKAFALYFGINQIVNRQKVNISCRCFTIKALH